MGATGCETNAQRSAAIEKRRLAQLRLHPVAVARGVSVTSENPAVRVLETTSVRGANGIAAVVKLLNVGARALRNAPIALTVSGGGGVTLYQNNAAGIEPSLVSAPLLLPGRATIWIDDQVQATGAPTGVRALVGQGAPVDGAVPALTVGGLREGEESEEGTVVNHSSVSQQQLVVNAVARRGGRVVAAGRAVLPEARAGGGTPFQIFMIGSAKGATLEVSAPATTLR